MHFTPRQRLVAAALATDPNAQFAPVQVQKLFFLIDENLAKELGGRQYRFVPYDYGPFDADVYRDLEQLTKQGFANISGGPAGARRYSLTLTGFELGQRELDGQSSKVRDYLTQASAWVRSLPFAQLVGSIYRAYPHMKANSIFAE